MQNPSTYHYRLYPVPASGKLLRQYQEHSPAPGVIDFLHIHDCLEVGLCLKGRGEFVVDDKFMPYRAGDCCVVSQFEFHRARSIGERPSEWVFFYFDPAELKYGDLTDDPWFESAALSGGRFRNILSGQSFPQLREAMRLLLAEARRADEDEAALRHLLRYLLRILHRAVLPETSWLAPSPSGARRAIERLAPALRAISRDYGGNVTVRRLAKECHMSESSFLRLFRSSFGKTPKRYLIEYRVQAGAYLLRHEARGVAEVALAVGYDSPSTFHRHFKAIHGRSPISCRQNISPDTRADRRRKKLSSEAEA